MGFENVRGWSEEDVWEIYRQAVREAEQGDTLIEVGVAYGRSLTFLAREALNSRKKVKVVGVDPWGHYGPDVFGGSSFNDFVREAGGFKEACVLGMMREDPEAYANCTLIQAESAVAAARFAKTEVSPSFVFIDANHGYESVLQDIKAWAPLVKRGGVIAGHDCTAEDPGVEKAVRELFVNWEKRGTCWWRRVE